MNISVSLKLLLMSLLWLQEAEPHPDGIFSIFNSLGHAGFFTEMPVPRAGCLCLWLHGFTAEPVHIAQYPAPSIMLAFKGCSCKPGLATWTPGNSASENSTHTVVKRVACHRGQRAWRQPTIFLEVRDAVFLSSNSDPNGWGDGNFENKLDVGHWLCWTQKRYFLCS